MEEKTGMVERKIKIVSGEFKERAGDNDNNAVSLNIQCSEWFAEEVLNRMLPLIKRDRQGSDFGLGNVNLTKTDTAIVNQISNDEQSHSSGISWWKRLSVAACLIFFVILSVFAFQTYSENRKEQALRVISYKEARLKEKAYEAVLAQNFDNLLNNLEELTAIYRFKKAFPEITSLPGIAMFKRGEKAAEKAEATKGFIFRVKSLFDRWTERPNYLAEDERPTEKDIAVFLSIWKETEVLLNRLKQAEENPLSLTATTAAAIQG